MQNQSVSLTLHIIDGRNIQFLHSVFRADNQIILRMGLHPRHRPVQPLRKGKIADRLENVIHGIHFISPDGILGQARHKKKNHIRIDFPYLPGRFHPIHHRHGNIQQDDIELASELPQKNGSVFVLGHVQLL